MAGMVLCFATMNACFVSAMALGTAANAIWLQYTAPLWVYAAGRLWLGDRPDWRSTLAVWLGGDRRRHYRRGQLGGERLGVVVLALTSGLTYAGS